MTEEEAGAKWEAILEEIAGKKAAQED